MMSSSKVYEMQFFMHLTILVNNSGITIVVTSYGFLSFRAGFPVLWLCDLL